MPTKAEIQFIKSLSQKKVRDQRGLFVAEGPKLVDELLDAPNIQGHELFATAEWLSAYGEKAEDSGGYLTEVNEQTLKKLSALATPNQVVALFEKPVFPESPDYHGHISLILDGVQDPGNMGSIVRCADWFGVGSVICSPTCADVFNPKVVQSTMGSVGRVRVIYSDLLSFTEQHDDIPIFAAALEGDSVYDMEPARERFLLIGNEAKGVDGQLLARATRRVTIPRIGGAESLNAAMATGILLSHLVR